MGDEKAEGRAAPIDEKMPPELVQACLDELLHYFKMLDAIILKWSGRRFYNEAEGTHRDVFWVRVASKNRMYLLSWATDYPMSKSEGSSLKKAHKLTARQKQDRMVAHENKMSTRELAEVLLVRDVQ